MELGELKAINKELSSQIGGCYFHFTQSLYKRIQFEDLSKLYAVDIECRRAYRKIETLAFIHKTMLYLHLKLPNYITNYQVNKDKRILKLVENYSKDLLNAYFDDFFCVKCI